MNMLIISGTLVADPDICMGEDGNLYARYALEVPKDIGYTYQPQLIPCRAFGKSMKFAVNQLKRGMKITAIGEIRIEAVDGTNKRAVYACIGKHEIHGKEGPNVKEV